MPSAAASPAFDAERARWKAEGLDSFIPTEDASPFSDSEIPAGQFGVSSAVPGSVWKILVEDGAHVEAGQPVAGVVDPVRGPGGQPQCGARHPQGKSSALSQPILLYCTATFPKARFSCCTSSTRPNVP